MAHMVGRPSDYAGEGKVWEALSHAFERNGVIYTNHSFEFLECDDCLMIDGSCIFIIEVKGWQAKDVVNVISEDEIILAKSTKYVRNPRRQARLYRFKTLDYLRDKLGFEPLVIDMVCYPFISKEGFLKKKLGNEEHVSMTLFAEDIKDTITLEQKILNAYEIMKSKIPHQELTHEMYVKIRESLETDYSPKLKQQDPNPGYSKLRVFANSADDSEVEKIVNEYFNGIKQYVFVNHKENTEKLIQALNKEFKARHIVPQGGNIGIGDVEDNAGFADSFNIFNFEVDYVEHLADYTDQNVLINEGECTPEQEELLKKIADCTAFNYQQYCIEHASADHNILVKAGAGTGKTYSMVSRIAFLCNKVRDPVEDLVKDIAMITFTNDAADNMKKRLKQLFLNYFTLTTNPKYLRYIEDLSQIQISTIHKFAISIMRKDCLMLGMGNQFDISSETYHRDQIYQQHLSDYLERKMEDDPDFSYQIHMPIYQLKKLLIAFASQLYNKSVDVKLLDSDSLGDPPQEISYFNELIKEVIVPAEIEYQDYLKSHNLVDLGQCMILLNKLVKGNSLQNHGLSYRYVFVDEFQDTDDVQIDTILHLQSLFGKQCRLFVVGDLKQSIYRFRGATLSAFDKIEQFNGTAKALDWKEYTLNRNYRSDAGLLSKFDEVFTKLGEQDLLPYRKPDDYLSSRIRKQYSGDDLVRKIEVQESKEEALYEAIIEELQNQITKLNDLCNKEKLSSEEKTIAILTRYNWQINKIVEKAKEAGITVDVTEGGDLYRLDSSIDLYKLTLALTHPEEPVYLVNFLLSNYISMKNSLLPLLSMNQEARKAEIYRLMDEYFVLRMETGWGQIIKQFQAKPVLSVLRDIYNAFQPWKHFSLDADRQRFYRENFECLIEELTKTYRGDYLTLNMVNEFLEINITTYQEQSSRDRNNDNTSVRVICTTIHKSKGLEYGTVMLPFTDEDISKLKMNGVNANMLNGRLSYMIGIKSGNRPEMVHNSNYQEDQENTEREKEECRILYVAMTRAIRNFVWFKRISTNVQNSWGSLLEVDQ